MMSNPCIGVLFFVVLIGVCVYLQSLSERKIR